MQDHRVSAHQRLKLVYLLSKFKFLRLKSFFKAKEAAGSLSLGNAIEEFRDEYGNKVRKDDVYLDREAGWIGGRVPVTEHSIPHYDPLLDPHCTYLASRNFQQSPFMKAQKAADDALDYYGKGGGKVGEAESVFVLERKTCSPLLPSSPPQQQADFFHNSQGEPIPFESSHLASEIEQVNKTSRQGQRQVAGVSSMTQDLYLAPIRKAVNQGKLTSPIRKKSAEKKSRPVSSAEKKQETLPLSLPPLSLSTSKQGHSIKRDNRFLQQLHNDVQSLKHELEMRGFLSSEVGTGSAWPPASNGDGSWVARVKSREKNSGGQRPHTISPVHILIFEERLKILDYPCMTVTSIWFTEDGYLEVRGKDTDNDVDLEHLMIHPIFVDKVCDCPTSKLTEIDEQRRREKLAELLKLVRVEGGALKLLIDPFIYEGVHVISGKKMKVCVMRLPAGNGVAVLAQPFSGPAADDPLEVVKLVVFDMELQILLGQHPTLFRKSCSSWGTQRQIAEWLVVRLSIYTDTSFRGLDGQEVQTSVLLLDRSIVLPPEKSSVVGADGAKFVICAWQEGEAIDFQCVKVEGEGNQKSSVRVYWAEIQAFCGVEALKQQEQTFKEGLLLTEEPISDFPELRKTPLDIILERIKVTDDGRVDLNRVVHRDIRGISGYSVVIHGSVLMRSIMFEAPKVRGQGQGKIECWEKVIPEDEALRLIASEPLELQKTLANLYNRAFVCRILVDALRFVEVGEKLVLETILYMSTDLLVVGMMTQDGRELPIGSVHITDRTLLVELRKTLAAELDPDRLPEEFTFLVSLFLTMLRLLR